MAKAADAFRTISEVSDLLDTPTHVLRFWESKFAQIKPVKRAGGRRYYRPQDISLLGGIKHLLHDQGMTIKSAQKLLRAEGVKHVASLSTVHLGDADDSTPKAKPAPKAAAKATPAAAPAQAAAKAQTETAPFFAFYTAKSRDTVRANAAKIAPLVARLEAVHARMR